MTGVGSAPGRLDVMGGVADYSGALVVETPIRARTTVRVAPSEDYRISSPGFGEVRTPSLDLATVPVWARYVLGCLRTFGDAKDWWPARGLSFSVESHVPVGMGVSSSAALEIATLRALSDLSGRTLDGLEIAHLAQRAENEQVGAPCGLMDQLTCAFGRPGELLPILCRPDRLLTPVRVPDGVTVVGCSTGVAHDVVGVAYATARVAAFMGKRLLEALHGRSYEYTTDIEPRDALIEDLPEQLLGREFVALHGGVDDTLSIIEPERAYPVRAATKFPIEEHRRSRRVIELLEAGGLDEIGEVMRASHEGYGAMGLGASEADRLVEQVRALGPDGGCYGARISGGGSGGTVVVLADDAAVARLPGRVIR